MGVSLSSIVLEFLRGRICPTENITAVNNAVNFNFVPNRKCGVCTVLGKDWHQGIPNIPAVKVGVSEYCFADFLGVFSCVDCDCG